MVFAAPLNWICPNIVNCWPIGVKHVDICWGAPVVEFLVGIYDIESVVWNTSVSGRGAHTKPAVEKRTLNSKFPTNLGKYLTLERGRNRRISIFSLILRDFSEPAVRSGIGVPSALKSSIS
jgi:hypothetical protein